MKRKSTESQLGLSTQPQLKKLKRSAILESIFWLPLAVLYIVAGQWYLLPLVLVIIIKVWQVYLVEKITIYQRVLLNDVMEVIENLPPLKSAVKQSKRRNTNASTNA